MRKIWGQQKEPGTAVATRAVTALEGRWPPFSGQGSGKLFTEINDTGEKERKNTDCK